MYWANDHGGRITRQARATRCAMAVSGVLFCSHSPWAHHPISFLRRRPHFRHPVRYPISGFDSNNNLLGAANTRAQPCDDPQWLTLRSITNNHKCLLRTPRGPDRLAGKRPGTGGRRSPPDRSPLPSWYPLMPVSQLQNQRTLQALQIRHRVAPIFTQRQPRFIFESRSIHRLPRTESKRTIFQPRQRHCRTFTPVGKPASKTCYRLPNLPRFSFRHTPCFF